MSVRLERCGPVTTVVLAHGLASLRAGAARFTAGEGRHGAP